MRMDPDEILVDILNCVTITDIYSLPIAQELATFKPITLSFITQRLPSTWRLCNSLNHDGFWIRITTIGGAHPLNVLPLIQTTFLVVRNNHCPTLLCEQKTLNNAPGGLQLTLFLGGHPSGVPLFRAHAISHIPPRITQFTRNLRSFHHSATSLAVIERSSSCSLNLNVLG